MYTKCFIISREAQACITEAGAFYFAVEDVASPQLTVLALSVSRLGTIQKRGLPCEQNSSFQWSSITVGGPTVSVGTLLRTGLRS